VLKTSVLAALICVLNCSAAAHAHATGAALDSLIDTTDIPKPLLATFERAYDEKWVVFGGGFKQNYFLLPRTIKATTRGTKTVWGVNVQGSDGGNWYSARAAIIQQRSQAGGDAAPYAWYLLTRVQWEIDCAHGRMRMLQLIDVDESGKVIGSWRYDDPLEQPVPDSNGENLVRSFCEPKLRVTFRDVVNTPMGEPVTASGEH
jgi:hypothetical protein